MKFLPVQRVHRDYYQSTADALAASMRAFLYDPIIAILAREVPEAMELFNAPLPVSTALQLAIRQGRIQYHDGVFSGEFDARITSALLALGAEFDLRAEVFRLPEWAVPAWVKAEVSVANARAQRIHDLLEAQLNKTQEKLDNGLLPAIPDAGAALDAIEDGFKTAAETLGIAHRLPRAARAALEQHYQDEVRPYVAEATSHYIDRLHQAVQENALHGYRYESMVEIIQHETGVSDRKARFLARQETGLTMSAYRRQRFEGVGIIRYGWSTSHDRRVRPTDGKQRPGEHGDHRILDGQIFLYSTKAPAKYMSCGHPCNPGEDFQCRCADRAVLE